MKTIVKVILPVLAFTLASAAAVSTNEAKIKESKKTVLIQGYIQNPSAQNCDPVDEVDCVTTASTQACMTIEAIPKRVFDKDESNACNVSLYRVEN
ncbi:DUF6520 family protein [Flavobacterium granuli]|uniref:Uncharacterized protein n=1 Tax=Flavobacterium granuli TaxID=280093 RepID=A0A1M5U619_9FLAO|nr:DUF6520 family protein [Flavobacterium granuli]PRZ19564.1 hypothetical protein BC624_11612 [Flavobacterium granuli]SHH58340.1 hypothetical protein SAMN05443373_11812 [Flavobacterium granuli]